MWDHLFTKFLGRSFKSGSLIIHLAGGRVLRFGDGTGDPVEVTLHDKSLTRKILQNTDLAVGEAYMNGEMTIRDDDLYGFMELAVKNMGRNGDRFNNPSKMQGIAQKARRSLRRISQYNPIGRAQENVAHHYDLSDAFYDLFLDADKQYSCGYYKTPDDTLEVAQAQKKAHIAKKLCLSPGMRVLDIGCGWGGLGLTLARDYGAEVVGVTLSKGQHKVAVARAIAEGLQDKVDFRLQDYRLVEGPFDRIVSVGMFEHVGVPHYAEYFDRVRDLLTDDGVALIHTIGRLAPPNVTSPWIAKYIFPGGYVPAMSEVAPAIEDANLITTDIEVWRIHYANTLRDWRTRFEANIDKVQKIYDARFCRMWRYYLVASEVTFRLDRQVVFQFQLTKRHGVVPVTRDYLYESGS
jgi:cyclopropane-fatty-acyl-phospholipid synthase